MWTISEDTDDRPLVSACIRRSARPSSLSPESVERRTAEVAHRGDLQLPDDEVHQPAEIMVSRPGDGGGRASEAEGQGAEDATSRELVLSGVFDSGEPDGFGQPCRLPGLGHVGLRKRLRHAAQDTRVGA